MGCRLIARVPDASRRAEEYAAMQMFQEAAETAATVSAQCHAYAVAVNCCMSEHVINMLHSMQLTVYAVS